MKAVSLLLPFFWSLEHENICSFLHANHSIIRKLLPCCKITNLESRACLWMQPFTVYHSRLWWFTVSRSLFSLPKTAFCRIGWIFVFFLTSPQQACLEVCHFNTSKNEWLCDFGTRIQNDSEWKNPLWHSQRQRSREGPERVKLQLHGAAWNGFQNTFRENFSDISASALSHKVLFQHKF